MSTERKYYENSVELTKLKHAIITTKSGQKALVLPIDDNYLTLKEERVYMQTSVGVNSEKDTNDNYGFQVQKLPSDVYKKLGADEAKKVVLPYIGNLKIFERKESKGDVIDLEINEDDDLAF